MNDQQLFETILNYTRDTLMIVDQNRHIVYITPNFYELTGFSPGEFQNRDIFDVLHPDDREYLMERHRNLLDSKQPNTTEYRIIKKNGEVRYCECNTTPLPDTENYLQVVSTRDITERKKMEMELEYHKNRHEVLQNSLKSFSQDLTAVMKLADLEERMIKELINILPGSNPMILNAIPKNLINGLESKEQDISDCQLVKVSDKILVKIGDRRERPYILSLKASAICEKMESIWLETLAHYSKMVFENLNIIENLMHQLETATQSQESPQWVLRMMFNLQEQQRFTLSSDLHDTVLQDQIDLYRRLESLLNRYEIETEAKKKLIEIEQGLLDIIHEIRVTCNNLRPPLLREMGLKRTLENLFEHKQISSTYKILFKLEDVSGFRLSEEQTIGIYRIVQEYLYYAEEFSKANTVEFDINYEKDRLIMFYHDDGIKFDAVGEAPSLENIRLTSVRQRAQSLGGKVDFSPKPAGGLTSFLELPIKIERSLV